MPGIILGNAVIESGDGTKLAVEDTQIPGDLRAVRNDGIGFGPLRLTSWADSTVVLSDLEFEEAEADSWIPFLSALGVAGTAAYYDEEDGEIHDPERTALTRRGLLVTVGATALFVGTASAQEEEEQTFSVASFDLRQNSRGLKVDVDQEVAEFLEGEDVEFFLSAEGSSIGTFAIGEPGKTINPGTEGTVELESDTALTFVQRIIAKAFADDTVVFEFRPQDESFADEAVGTEVQLSSQPLVVETVEASDPDEVVIKMNGSVIPHADERGNSTVGEWYVRDGTSLQYVVGEGTPDTTLVEIQTNAGLLDRLTEKCL